MLQGRVYTSYLPHAPGQSLCNDKTIDLEYLRDSLAMYNTTGLFYVYRIIDSCVVFALNNPSYLDRGFLLGIVCS